MPIAMTVRPYGVIVIDEEGRLLWEWTYPNMRMYGLDVDPATGNFFVTVFNQILEVTRTGRVVWQFSSPETLGLHSLQRTFEGTILVSAAIYDKVLEIDKMKGIVWRWDAAEHYTPPPGHEERTAWGYDKLLSYQWTHLNHAWRLPNGDTLIGMYHTPSEKLPIDYKVEEQPDGIIVRVDKKGEVLWEWGTGVTLHQHYVLPYDDGYIVADSHNKRVLKFTLQEVTWEMVFEEQPLGLDIKPNGNILVSFPASLKIREISFGEGVIWEYEVPENLRAKGSKIFVPKYLPEWGVDYTEEEKMKVEERLRRLGYIA